MVCENGKKASPSILVLIAALNEEDGIGLTLSELSEFLKGYQILVVDGNSNDTTVHIAKSLGADVVYQKGKGKGDAICYALGHINDRFDFIIFTDGDYTYPAEYIPQMIGILEKNPDIGMVCGNRFNAHLELSAMRDVFYFGNRIIAFTHNLVSGLTLKDPLTGLRVIRGDLVKNWQPKSAGFDIEVELNNHIERQGYSIKEIDIPYRKRFGIKKLKVRDGIIIIKRIITERMY